MPLRMRISPALTATFLLLCGVWLWQYTTYAPPFAAGHYVALAVAGLAAVIPPVSRRVSAALDRLRRPSPRPVRLTALAIAVLAATYLPLTAVRQGRHIAAPVSHDESMYLVQMQLLARGRLWMPPHELADFFETFHVFVEPVYAPMHFYGTALLYVPTVWLNLPIWLMPALVAGATAALLYLVLTEVIDGLAGLLGVAMLLSLTQFRWLGVTVMSHGVIIFLGLLLVWAWLRWRGRAPGASGWALLIGVAAGWAAVTRPFDALAYALPVGVAVLFDLRRAVSVRQAAGAVGLILVGAAPFLAGQVWFNAGVTGSPWTTPYRHYTDLYHPGSHYGYHRLDPDARTISTLPQKQVFFDDYVIPNARRHQRRNVAFEYLHRRLPMIATWGLPHPLLLVLAPVGLLALRRPGRPVLAAVLPTYLLLYVPNAYLLEHYVPTIAPSLFCLILLGKEALEDAVAPVRSAVTTGLTLAIVVACAAAVPELNPHVRDPGVLEGSHVNRLLAGPAVQKPAVVLFRYDRRVTYHQEPVFNFQSADPDDAAVVRAHDLGPGRNVELFRYYGARQPGRHVYLYDRLTKDLRYLGTAGNLASQAPATRPTTTATTTTSRPTTRPAPAFPATRPGPGS